MVSKIIELIFKGIILGLIIVMGYTCFHGYIESIRLCFISKDFKNAVILLIVFISGLILFIILFIFIFIGELSNELLEMF